MEPGQFVVRQRHLDRAGLTGNTTDQAALLELDDHLVNIGDVTWKNRWKSAPAVGRRFNRVYVEMKAGYCPCLSVNREAELLDTGAPI